MPASKRSPVFRVFIRDGVSKSQFCFLLGVSCMLSGPISTLPAVYLAVITATNTANVAFFAQQDSSLKGAAMAFQFLFASLISCRMVLSLRDTEMLAVQSAAGSKRPRPSGKQGTLVVTEIYRVHPDLTITRLATRATPIL